MKKESNNWWYIKRKLEDFEAIEASNNEQIFENINFVITGSVEQFKNRDELKEIIEERGGKVTGSVSSKTNYLINNDNLSNSSKNKKAKELGIKYHYREPVCRMAK